MLRLVPTLLRAGWSEDEIFNQLRERYDDDFSDREIDEVVRWCVERFAASGTAPVNKSAWAKRQSHLRAIKTRAARSLAHEILRGYQWPAAAITAHSQIPIPDEPLAQTWAFLATLWQPADRLWFGVEATESGQAKHNQNFTTIADAYWRIHDGWRPEFVSQYTFQPSVFSRCNDMVMIRKYFVVESDVKNGGLGNDEVGAVFRWLAEKAGFALRAVVFSGNQSLHGWFEWKPNQPFDELRAVIEALRCDPAPLTTTQPVRLAGMRRANTNQLQTLLYLS